MTPSSKHPMSEREEMAAKDIVVRLRSNAQLPVCPYDRRSPDYWTAPNDKPCVFCGQENTSEGPDLCRGADTRVMEEAAAEIERLRGVAATPLSPSELTPAQVYLINDMIHAWIEPDRKGEFRQTFRNDCKRLLATVSAAPAPLATSREGVEDFRWLIEAPGARYLAVQRLHMSDNFEWTSDHNKALAFRSQDQADALMMAVRQMDREINGFDKGLFAFEANLGDAKAVEHGWFSLAARPQQADAGMREALEKFTAHYEPWMDAHSDDVECIVHSRHTFGDLRRARTALAKQEPSTPPLPEPCSCVGAVIDSHDSSCPLSRPEHST